MLHDTSRQSSEISHSLHISTSEPVKLVALDYSIDDILLKLNKTLIQYYRGTDNQYNVSTWKHLDPERAPTVTWHCDSTILEGFIVGVFFNSSRTEGFKVSATLEHDSVLNAIGDINSAPNKSTASTKLGMNQFAMIYWEVIEKSDLKSIYKARELCNVEIFRI